MIGLETVENATLLVCGGPVFNSIVAAVGLHDIDGPLFSCIGIMPEACSEAVLFTDGSDACLLSVSSTTY